MARNVYESRMVAHIWANQGQESARNHNKQFYFEGRAIYSYGPHYVAGFLMPDGTALVNADSYSITTSRHVSYVRGAVRGTWHSIPSLTRLYDDALRWISSAEIEPAIKRAIFAFTRQNWDKLSEDAIHYLLGLAGRGKSYDKLKREVEREKAAENKRAAKVALEHKLEGAKRFDSMSDSDFEAQTQAHATRKRYVSRTWKQWRLGYPRYELESESLRAYARYIHGLWKAAKDAKREALAKRIYARMLAIRQRAKRMAAIEARTLRAGIMKSAISDFRTYAKRWRSHVEDGVPLIEETESSFLFAFSQSIGTLCNELPEGRFAALRSNLDSVRIRIEDARHAAIARERAAIVEAERQAREEWQAGKRSYFQGVDETNGAYLRARDVERDESGAIVAGTLETSLGASVPLVHALKAFAFVRKVVERGQEWRANGKRIRVGHFYVDAIAPDGRMKAGCHIINFPEMCRLASELRVDGIASSDEALEDSGH